jgi:cytochrome bd-type quinol oxidase subunit 2
MATNRNKNTGKEEIRDFAFQKVNYLLLITGLVVLIVGFLLMIGGGTTDPNVFNEEVFSFSRWTLSPILILLGYVIEIVAIMYRPKSEEELQAA